MTQKTLAAEPIAPRFLALIIRWPTKLLPVSQAARKETVLSPTRQTTPNAFNLATALSSSQPQLPPADQHQVPPMWEVVLLLALAHLALLDRTMALVLVLQRLPQLLRPRLPQPVTKHSSWVLPALASWGLSWLSLLCRG